LLNEGRTDLLRGFVSNRTRRKFSAYLIKKPDGTTGFEFEPRPVKDASAAKRVTSPVNGEAVEPPLAKPVKKTHSRPAVVDGTPAVVRTSKAKKVSTVATRKSAKATRGNGSRKPAARR
ncbi:MAG TPA: topoisomerase C-terminal repeat-containing protein, partial [Burkholderiaceae bacterium]|nr:topoisomerase C-terminal repeat-containing protein [Burkholderiaceae bacterium]